MALNSTKDNSAGIRTDKLITDYLSDFSDTPENFRKIFVGGLSWATTEDRLQQFFEKMGAPVDRLAIMRDKLTGRSRGFGFVTFVSLDGLNLVLSRKHQLDGRTIECKRAIPKSEISTKMKKVFVGGIPLTLEESQLRKYFEKFGHVEECRIMTDGVLSRSRGFAFVCFSDDEVLNTVLSVPHSIEGKCFEVKKARGKAGQPEPQLPPTVVPPFYVPYNFPMALPRGQPPFPGFYVYPSLDPSLIGQTDNATEVRVDPSVGQNLRPIEAAVNLTQINPENPQKTDFDMDSLNKAFNGLEVPSKATNRRTLPVSSGKRGDKQNLNRTVSAHDKLESLHASSSTTGLGLQLKPLLSLNLQPSASIDDIDSTKPTGAGKTISQRRIGKPRSDKQKVNRTVSAHPTLQSIPSKVVIQSVSPRPPLKSYSAQQQNPRPNAPLSATGRLPSHDFFSETDASYLERELNRLGAKAGNQTGNMDKKAPIDPTKVESNRKRGVSSPVLPLDTIRHLDLNWRSGGKTSESTIHKYFPVLNTTELTQG